MSLTRARHTSPHGQFIEAGCKARCSDPKSHVHQETRQLWVYSSTAQWSGDGLLDAPLCASQLGSLFLYLSLQFAKEILRKMYTQDYAAPRAPRAPKPKQINTTREPGGYPHLLPGHLRGLFGAYLARRFVALLSAACETCQGTPKGFSATPYCLAAAYFKSPGLATPSKATSKLHRGFSCAASRLRLALRQLSSGSWLRRRCSLRKFLGVLVVPLRGTPFVQITSRC